MPRVSMLGSSLDLNHQSVARRAGPDTFAQRRNAPDGSWYVSIKPAPEVGDDDPRREPAEELDQIRYPRMAERPAAPKVGSHQSAPAEIAAFGDDQVELP